ncbi:hypothetical protein C440_06567 [Haloferax mucosum ATCC BAA-1512]|uniref:Uncharacterized protein n=1 Tax=Haloferax mucosum ATCC BAA-1512 TaxID=662479 RepID=M0IIR7_9EURY|nr:hypothetical protein [Haloferax mucosum]ELZ95932.1 hypothetical protein C440_06567 [Haloferax mucosum ATCC BAA-1512]
MERAVYPVQNNSSNTEMGLIGTFIVAGLFVLSIPLLPFILLGLLKQKLSG